MKDWSISLKNILKHKIVEMKKIYKLDKSMDNIRSAQSCENTDKTKIYYVHRLWFCHHQHAAWNNLILVKLGTEIFAEGICPKTDFANIGVCSGEN